jgi:hypothetical protein
MVSVTFSTGIERKKFTLFIISCLDPGSSTKTTEIENYIMFYHPKKVVDKVGSAATGKELPLNTSVGQFEREADKFLFLFVFNL